MKNYKVGKKVDDLGRICIPVDFRKALNITKGVELQLYIENEKLVVEKKNAVFTEKISLLREAVSKHCPEEVYALLDGVLKEVT